MSYKNIQLHLRRYLALALLGFSLLAALPAAAVELVMFTDEYCPWCEKWEKDIGVMYHMTDEGKKAPLTRVDENQAGSFKQLQRGIHFTPTFVLVDKDREVGRITGYPGEHFFFPMLNNLLARVQK